MIKKVKNFSCWDAMRLIGGSIFGLDVLYLIVSGVPQSGVHLNILVVFGLMSFSFLFLFFSTKKIC